MVYEAPIEQVLDALESDSNKDEMIKATHDHFQSLFDYLSSEYSKELTEDEFDRLDFGAFLMCAVLLKANPNQSIDLDDYIDHEERFHNMLESKKSLASYFASISVHDKKVELYDFAEELHEIMKEEELPALTINIISSVVLSIVESV